MTKTVKYLLVSYDIRDPKRLLRVAKIMKDYGTRVLKSVFECSLDDNSLAAMKRRIEEVLDPMEDSVRFYFLCGKCVGRVEVTGNTSIRFTDDRDFIAI
jgi:CRISPR-associated protein Cas2